MLCCNEATDVVRGFCRRWNTGHQTNTGFEVKDKLGMHGRNERHREILPHYLLEKKMTLILEVMGCKASMSCEA